MCLAYYMLLILRVTITITSKIQAPCELVTMTRLELATMHDILWRI